MSRDATWAREVKTDSTCKVGKTRGGWREKSLFHFFAPIGRNIHLEFPQNSSSHRTQGSSFGEIFLLLIELLLWRVSAWESTLVVAQIRRRNRKVPGPWTYRKMNIYLLFRFHTLIRRLRKCFTSGSVTLTGKNASSRTSFQRNRAYSFHARPSINSYGWNTDIRLRKVTILY